MPWGRFDLAPLLVAPAVVLAVLLVLAAVAVCWAVRKGVAHGIRDARRAEQQSVERSEV